MPNGISSLGKIVAKEIKEEILKVKTMGKLGQISMIGHSMGGLVIRDALQYLRRYKNRLHTLITLGTPH